MDFNINAQLKLKKQFLMDKRVEGLKRFNNWTRIVLIYMMLVGFAERSRTGNVVVFEDGTPVPFCRMHELFSHSRSFLEYAFCALKSVSLIEMIRFQDDNATIVATNGLFYA
ncbi:MAG: hypothetical protein IKK70_03970 [Clostridia bacterium]|nr:hypothetical protein [Clostridia bacterium]